jgi:hypothetical protein
MYTPPITRYLFSRDHAWWIGENPADPEGPIGPYKTKAEAADDMRGLNRTDRYEGRRGFVTSTPPSREKRVLTAALAED